MCHRQGCSRRGFQRSEGLTCLRCSCSTCRRQGCQARWRSSTSSLAPAVSARQRRRPLRASVSGSRQPGRAECWAGGRSTSGPRRADRPQTILSHSAWPANDTIKQLIAERHHIVTAEDEENRQQENRPEVGEE